MNLTEPQAGSDLAAVRTRAVPQPDGSYRLTGQKIFITYGEHDYTENIVHLVLARLPDAPEGVKGISLFVVPKFIPDAEGSPGERNDVTCVSIEHKLGIHASPTCVMSYGEKGGARRLDRRRAEPRARVHVRDDEPRALLRRHGGRGHRGSRLPARGRVRARARAGPRRGTRQGREGRSDHRAPGRAADADDDAGVDRGRCARLAYVTAAAMDNAHEPSGRRGAQAAPGVRRLHDPDRQGPVDRDRPGSRLARRAGARRHGLHRGDRRRAALPRRAHHDDLRGHDRDPGERPDRPQDRARRRRGGGRDHRGGREARSPAAGLRRRDARGDRRAARARRRPLAGRATAWMVGAYGDERARGACGLGRLPAHVGRLRRRLADGARGGDRGAQARGGRGRRRVPAREARHRALLRRRAAAAGRQLRRGGRRQRRGARADGRGVSDPAASDMSAGTKVRRARVRRHRRARRRGARVRRFARDHPADPAARSVPGRVQQCRAGLRPRRSGRNGAPCTGAARLAPTARRAMSSTSSRSPPARSSSITRCRATPSSSAATPAATVRDVAIVCYPTTAANARADYPLPDGDVVVPRMQRGGDAPILPPGGRLPVLVYSHGFAGSPVDANYLGAMFALASQGYVTVAPFHGDLRYSLLGFEAILDDGITTEGLWRDFVAMQAIRPVGASALLDALAASSAMARRPRPRARRRLRHQPGRVDADADGRRRADDVGVPGVAPHRRRPAPRRRGRLHPVLRAVVPAEVRATTSPASTASSCPTSRSPAAATRSPTSSASSRAVDRLGSHALRIVVIRWRRRTTSTRRTRDDILHLGDRVPRRAAARATSTRPRSCSG